MTLSWCVIFIAKFLQLTFPAGRCDPVPIVDHAVANSSSAEAGTVVGYTCEYGYIFNGLESPTVYCNGISWSDLRVQCTGSIRSVLSYRQIHV